MRRCSPRFWNLSGFLVCCILLVTAFIMQYFMGLRPCLLCIMTRVVFVVLAIVLLVAGIHNPKGYGLRIYGVLVVLVSAMGVALAARHVWLEYQPPSANEVCLPGFGILLQTLPLKDVLRLAVVGTSDCARMSTWTILGLSLAMWTLVCFVIYSLLGVLQTFWRYVKANGT